MTAPRLPRADRRTLLLGTALASTLLLGTLIAPSPAAAQVTCAINPPNVPAPPGRIEIIDPGDSIDCVNVFDRNNGAELEVIHLETDGANEFITLDNSGTLTATNAGDARGIYARIDGANSPISITNSGDIAATTTNGFVYGIFAHTYGGADSPIGIWNSGNITAYAGPAGFNAIGIRARGIGAGPIPVTIWNSGDIRATSAGQNAYGIFADNGPDDSPIEIWNSGTIRATADDGDAFGIDALPASDGSRIDVTNSGGIWAIASDDAYGIRARPFEASLIGIVNTGTIAATAGDDATGIFAGTDDVNSSISIVSRGHIAATADDNATGIYALAEGANSRIGIVNSGDIRVSAGNDAYGILAETDALNSDIDITNSGNVHAAGASAVGILAATDGDNSTITIVEKAAITATGDFVAFGIYGYTYGADSNISIANASHITATAGVLYGIGISAQTYGVNSDIRIVNSGDIDAQSQGLAYGIRAFTGGPGSAIDIVHSGGITSASAYAAGIIAVTSYNNSPISIASGSHVTVTGTIAAVALGAGTVGDDSPVTIVNSGRVTATARYSYGIEAYTYGANSPLTIVNSGQIAANGGAGGYASGIFAGTYGPNSPILIQNAGSIFGTAAGIHIHAYSGAGATIVNSGDISAGSLLAIDAHGPGNVSIFNSGTITGFVLLDADDRFINQAGGVFEARLTSDFDATGPGGNDLFVNQAGATVHADGDTRFVNLETFRNQGLISMLDGDTGDSFTISNTPGGTDLDFVASGNSRLAVDAFLGGPGNSSSDTFTIEGDVSGVTTVQVVNTNYGPGVFNPTGIRVVTVTGATPNPNAFQLDQSIDTGFFNYDLFFTPTGSGFWNLRSFPGGGAFLLPQLVTAAQDIWHQSASTWFDRTADLRVLLAGGPAPTAYDPGGKSLGVAGPYPLTPAVWARGSGSWLDRDDTARTTAYGRDYSFDLDRELQTLDFQVGVDLGKRDALTQGDALVFGLLGGFVHGDLDYDALARSFNFDGGQVGAYATYLNGALFVDTLLNVHLYSLETSTLGFPSSLNANTVGVRTDTGYRFGSFRGGPFLEPLATIEVTWADIDGFSLGGNTVSFDDDANVRGRLGLRAGTTMNAWEGTLMEPFVTGSLWGNFTGDNSATLVSTGRTFRFEDQLDDVWGEVSAGVNVFNFSQTTAVFAKLDVIFGDDLTGVGGKAGMRVNW